MHSSLLLARSVLVRSSKSKYICFKQTSKQIAAAKTTVTAADDQEEEKEA
jgi:hypothetical protein